MSTGPDVTILHITDLHISGRSLQLAGQRLAALASDVKELGHKIDLIIFSGDIAFSGQQAEYQHADAFITELSERLNVSKDRVVVCPGNHDVNRSSIDNVIEKGLRETLENDDEADAIFQNTAYSHARLTEFYAFAQAYGWEPNRHWHHKRLVISRIPISILCLNTAWRSSGDKDKLHLFLSPYQVTNAITQTPDAALTIAVLHHPFTWLNERDDDEAGQTLRRECDVILTGHLHQNKSLQANTATDTFVNITGPALLDGKFFAGYNIYTVDYADQRLHAYYRLYVPGRDAYDKNTQHAKDGHAEFRLHLEGGSKFDSTLLATRLRVSVNEMRDTLHTSLSALQGDADPILVKPAVKQVTFKNNEFHRSREVLHLLDHVDTLAFVYGDQESGKTILLQMLAQQVNEASSPLNLEFAQYIDLKDHVRSNAQDILDAAFIHRAPHLTQLPETKSVLLLDHFDHLATEQQAELLRLLKGSSMRARTIIATNHGLLFRTLLQQEADSASFFEMCPWGPSRIRQLVERRFTQTGIDVDAAYKFVVDTLKTTDLPSLPTVVLLYLTIFPLLEGGELTSISFLRLLEKFEERRFGDRETSAADSLYNKRRVLAHLALKIINDDNLALSLGSFEELTREYFDNPGINFNHASFLASLLKSGIVRLDSDRISFSCNVFLDYYLAQAFEERIGDVQEYTASLREALNVVDAIALYGGLRRTEKQVAEALLSCLKAEFDKVTAVDLNDLDVYIKDLLLPTVEADEVEGSLERSVASKRDPHEEDESYSESREVFSQRPPREDRLLSQLSRIEKAAILIRALMGFYKLFRNLENIPLEDKVKMLDSILDFHLHCNLQLCDIFSGLIDEAELIEDDIRRKEDVSFRSKLREPLRDQMRTVVAYMATMSGANFLSSFVGSQSLRRTLELSYDSTTNSFKKLLIAFLMADLAVSGWEERISTLLQEISSRSGVEMIYLKVRSIILEKDSKRVSTELKDLFRLAVSRRMVTVGGKATKGALNELFEKEMEAVRRDRLQRHVEAEDAVD